MNKATLRVLFIIWTILWVNFMMRDLIGKGHLYDYKALMARDADGKRSYAYGDRFFEFLKFCEKTLPEYADYDLIGTEGLSIEGRRAVYYLYPHIKKDKASFLLVFDRPGFKKTGYVLYEKLDDSRFILRRA